MNIKRRREELGISQKELAKKADISQSMLCDIEKGRCKPSIYTAIKLAKVLQIDDIKFFEQWMYKHSIKSANRKNKCKYWSKGDCKKWE